jgi:hypothetical protein
MKKRPGPRFTRISIAPPLRGVHCTIWSPASKPAVVDTTRLAPKTARTLSMVTTLLFLSTIGTHVWPFLLAISCRASMMLRETSG